MNSLYETLDALRIVQARLETVLMSPARPWPGAAVIQDRSILLYGPRGVGKTSYFCAKRRHRGAPYLSMDHPGLANVSVYDAVEALFQRGAMRIFLDEIHYKAHWSEDLKALHDAWPDRSLKGYPDFQVHDPFASDVAWVPAVMAAGNILELFEKYLSSGLRPIFMEGEDRYAIKILQVVQKTMEADIPWIVQTVTQNHFRLMNAVLGYLAQTNYTEPYWQY